MYAGCIIIYVKSTSVFVIDRRVVSMLPSIYFSEGGELGIVSVRSLIKKFGSCQSKLGKCLAGSTISWFGMVYHPQHILAKKSKVAFC